MKTSKEKASILKKLIRAFKSAALGKGGQKESQVLLGQTNGIIFLKRCITGPPDD
jgi:hypothetical protein